MPPDLDPRLCPLCGADNACGAEAGAADCWCSETKIPADVLELIPATARDKACVCARCAAGQASAAPTARPLKTVSG